MGKALTAELINELSATHECEEGENRSIIGYGVPEWARPAWDNNSWWIYRKEASDDGVSFHLIPEFTISYCPYCGTKLEPYAKAREPEANKFNFDIDKDNISHNGLNISLKAHVLSDDDMVNAGFKKQNGLWTYFRSLGSDTDVSFSVIIKQGNESDFHIDVIDENFGQPYDYQHILKQNPNNKFSLRIWTEVEKHMKKLTDAGIIAGHTFGQYI